MWPESLAYFSPSLANRDWGLFLRHRKKKEKVINTGNMSALIEDVSLSVCQSVCRSVMTCHQNWIPVHPL